MAEQKQITSNRDRLGERLKKKYPDKEYADDEAIFGQIGDDYDEYEKQIGDYKDREGRLTELLANDPHSAQFITDMSQGKDPWVSLINRIGIDGVKEMLEDPEKMEEYAKSNKEYIERMAESKRLEGEWRKNIEQTLSMLESKQAEKGLSDEEVDAAADWIKAIANDALMGIIKEETFEMAMKAINHDKDVSVADREGEIRGRNARAEAQLRKPGSGDGMPVMRGSNNGPAPQQQKPKTIFSLADEAV